MDLFMDDYEKLCGTYGVAMVDDVLDQMENYKKLDKYTSAYLTANNWLKKRAAISLDTVYTPKESY